MESELVGDLIPMEEAVQVHLTVSATSTAGCVEELLGISLEVQMLSDTLVVIE